MEYETVFSCDNGNKMVNIIRCIYVDYSYKENCNLQDTKFSFRLIFLCYIIWSIFDGSKVCRLKKS